MAGKASNYHRGEMDIAEQRRTYHAFLVMSKWGSLAILAGVLFFSLVFAVGAGFLASTVTTFIITVVGVVLLREKKKPAH